MRILKTFQFSCFAVAKYILRLLYVCFFVYYKTYTDDVISPDKILTNYCIDIVLSSICVIMYVCVSECII